MSPPSSLSLKRLRDYMTNYYANDLSKPDTMSGVGFGFEFRDTPDLIVVLSHPSKYRAALKGNQVIGPKSVEFLQREWQRAWPDDVQEPLSTYWTFLVKNHTTKKKPPIAEVRSGLQTLLEELQGMLANFERGTEEQPIVPRILVQGGLPACGGHVESGRSRVAAVHPAAAQ